MKTRFLLSLIFLLAIGGNASAQLVLPICSVNLPCPGFPLGSVQAPIDQNGWRNFKVTLTSNVTSFSFQGIPPSPAQASVNIIFTQDATGGRTVSFAAGITSTCTVTSTANATTLCQFEYDGTAGVWISISGGGGSGTWEAGAGVSTAGTVADVQSDPFLAATTGGASCSPSNVYTSGGVNTANKVYDGMTSCVNTATTGTLNAFYTAVAGLAQNNDPTTGGVNGWAGTVGVGGFSFCNAGTAAHCWGSNFGAADKSGNSGTTLIGTENDMQVNNNSSVGFGYIAVFQGNGQPTGDNFPAYAITANPTGTGKFTSGFECKNGTISNTNTFGCLVIGKQTAAGQTNSQFALFDANDGGADIIAGLSLQADHVWAASASMAFGAGPFANFFTSTNTLQPSTLVKIDTANADSFVICTTTDTSCQGIIAESVLQLCGGGSTSCPIITIPGSRTKAFLGTGTCAIGNNVVVDTTTNGRIKCQAAVPAQGAWIGIAISAQSTVGNLVDIITKFQ